MTDAEDRERNNAPWGSAHHVIRASDAREWQRLSPSVVEQDAAMATVLEAPDVTKHTYFAIGSPAFAGLRLYARPWGDGTWLMHVWVTPRRRRQGYGSALCTLAESLAAQEQADSITCKFIEVPASGAAPAFLKALGFTRRYRKLRLTLDLEDYQPGQAAVPSDIRLFPYSNVVNTSASRARLRRLMSEVEAEILARDQSSRPDVPGRVRPAMTSAVPGWDPSLLWLAAEQRAWVGLTQILRKPGADSGHVFITGVLTSFRGLGVGTALKQQALHAAKTAGCVSVTSVVHDDNTAILTLNHALGFREYGAYCCYTKLLTY